MDTGHLREFVVLAENLSFSETAKRLFITQSTLSRHILNLEEELCCSLFSRDSHHVKLTREGQEFYESARIILGYTDAAKDKIVAMRAMSRIPLRIGYLFDAAQGVVPCMNDWLERSASSVQPEFVAIEYGYLMRSLMERSVDLAITMDIDEEIHALYDSFPLYPDCYYFGVSKDNPLASRQSVSVDDIRRQSDLIFPNSSVVSASYLRFTELLGEEVNLRVHSYYSDMRTLLLFIGAGAGTSLVAGHHAMASTGNIAFIPIEDVGASFTISVMWHRDLSSTHLGIIAAMRKAFGMRDQAPSKMVRAAIDLPA